MENIKYRHWSFLRFIFHVFNYGKWNELDSGLAYATRHSETLSEIYRSPLYMKAFSKYKREIKVFQFPRVLFST